MICRECFNENIDGAEICAFCGASLIVTPQEEVVGRIYCTQCGVENRDDALYCVSCRTLLGEAPEIPVDYRPSPQVGEGNQEFPPSALLTLLARA